MRWMNNKELLYKTPLPEYDSTDQDVSHNPCDCHGEVGHSQGPQDTRVHPVVTIYFTLMKISQFQDSHNSTYFLNVTH